MVNWAKLFEEKTPKDPVKAAKNDLFMYGVITLKMSVILGFLIMADGNSEVLNLIGVEVYSRIAIGFGIIVLTLYGFSVLSAIQRLRKAKKAPA